MAAIVVIPARYASTRFPAKVLAAETGRPLVQHVVDQVRRCNRVSDIIVAADDERIIQALELYGTKCVMTSPTHQSGTDRVAEIAERFGAWTYVNVQGDEPEIEPVVVDALVDRVESGGVDMATAATRFPPDADPADPNLVKVVTDPNGRALYFSRSPIPFYRQPVDCSPVYRLHLGIYAYRRDFIRQFTKWPQSRLEKAEKLEQLRALENGCAVYVNEATRATHGIDTPEQYADFVTRYHQKMKSVAPVLGK